MVRNLYRKYNKNYKINLVVKKKYLYIVRDIYRDLKNLKFLSIITYKSNKYENEIVLKSIKDKNYKLIKIGHDYIQKNKKFMNKLFTCDMLFYKQLGFSYNDRFKKSYWKRDRLLEKKLYKRLINSKKFAFIHDDPSRGFVIEDNMVSKNLNIVRNNTNINILHYGKILENAEEIHLMESSIRCMIENIKIKSKKNFLYKFIDGPYKSIPFYKNGKIIGSKIQWKIKHLKYRPSIIENLKRKLKYFILRAN